MCARVCVCVCVFDINVCGTNTCNIAAMIRFLTFSQKSCSSFITYRDPGFIPRFPVKIGNICARHLLCPRKSTDISAYKFQRKVCIEDVVALMCVFFSLCVWMGVVFAYVAHITTLKAHLIGILMIYM